MFDDCYDLETVFFEEGRAQGAIDARSRGIERGRADATADGRRIGMEIGFYAGCARALVLLASEQADAVDARCVALRSEDCARRRTRWLRTCSRFRSLLTCVGAPYRR